MHHISNVVFSFFLFTHEVFLLYCCLLIQITYHAVVVSTVGAFRDFHSFQSTLCFVQLSLYSNTFYGDLWQSVALLDH